MKKKEEEMEKKKSNNKTFIWISHVKEKNYQR